ncbi:MAG: MFS transporter [Anaerolineales bacterium]|nr:MFS transporter [Anaerolineales bacterium]
MTSLKPANPDPYAALRYPEFRYWLGANSFATLAGRALAVTLGYQIYELTKDPLALGVLGLIEAIPSISLALFGGHIADRYNRHRIVLLTRAVSCLSALAFAWISTSFQAQGLFVLYAIVFVAGLARGMGDPAASAFEAQIVPRALYINAATWGGSIGQVTAIVGPALGGFVYAWFGVTNTYLMIAGLFALAVVCILFISPKPMPPLEKHESIWQSISIGVRFVFREQILVGAMALDLFAVLFGGAVALLPVFASEILKVGPSGLGMLAAAPSVGAFLSMVWATRFPPIKRAGKILLGVVGGFGVAIIVFALSKNFYLSLFALALSGFLDGISMVIRSTILRLYSPEHLRGRIAAVNWIFIGSSNEIGAFESGFAAKLLGTIPSVVLGGIATLLIVGITAFASSKLRNMNLDAPIPIESPAQVGT